MAATDQTLMIELRKFIRNGDIDGAIEFLQKKAAENAVELRHALENDTTILHALAFSRWKENAAETRRLWRPGGVEEGSNYLQWLPEEVLPQELLGDVMKPCKCSILFGLLVEYGANVNATDKDGKTPLHFAAGSSHAMVNALLDNGANISAQDKFRRTPLEEALYAGNVSTAHALLARGAADTDIQAAQFSFFKAVQNGNEAMVRFLLERRADINISAPGKDGDTPLCIAAEDRYEAVVRLLLEHDADPNIPNSYGRTPLHIAALRYTGIRVGASANDEAIVRLLLDNGADVNKHNTAGKRPIDLAENNNIAELLRAKERELKEQARSSVVGQGAFFRRALGASKSPAANPSSPGPRM